jgi:DNA ligase-1
MLYKRTKTGAVQVWSVEVEENKFRTVEGQLNGKMTTSEWTTCVGKNIGKTNETSPEQQAILEAKAKEVKKLESGYVVDINTIDTAKAELISPMLAEKFEKNYVTGQEAMYYSQPKLDGMRMETTVNGTFSRNGKPVVSVPHLDLELSKFFEEFGEEIVVDGEIYNHELKADFNKLISYAKKTKPTADDLVNSEKYLQYHIYDMQFKDKPNISFDERFLLLSNFFDNNNFKYLKLVETIIVNDDAHLDELYTKYLEEGYEGQMVRLVMSKYENNRTKSLLKRKEFIDEEFIITDISEGTGNRSGMMGRIHLVDKDGIHFESGCRGNHDYYKELLINKHLYINKTATCRYQGRTPDLSYRFPVVIQIAREEYE